VAFGIVSIVLAMAGDIEFNIHATTNELIASHTFHSALDLSSGSTDPPLMKLSNPFAFRSNTALLD
jgi:hypothetical protein